MASDRLVIGHCGVNGYGEPRIWCLICNQGDTPIYADDLGMDEARCWCCEQSLIEVAEAENA